MIVDVQKLPTLLEMRDTTGFINMGISAATV